MDYSPEALIRERLNDLEGTHRGIILEGGTLRKAFVRKHSLELNIPQSKIDNEIEKIAIVEHKKIEKLSELADKELKNINLFTSIDKQAQQARWHKEFVLIPWAKAQIIDLRIKEGYSLEEAKAQGVTEADLTAHIQANKHNAPKPTLPKEILPKDLTLRNKYNILMRDIKTLLKQHKQGLNKSTILTMLKKNGSWRPALRDALTYLELKGVVTKVGTKYVYKDFVKKPLETDFHRNIYESLINGPLSITQMLKIKNDNGKTIIGYDNGYGRRKIKEVLYLLWREGLIEKVGNHKWQISS